MPYRGRALTSVTVSTFAELQTALSGNASTIRLAAGTYSVASTDRFGLTISRGVTLTADVEGSSVVLDGGNARRVMRINSGTVQLTGLTITNGYLSVRRAFPCASLRVGAPSRPCAHRSCVPKASTRTRKSEHHDALAFGPDLHRPNLFHCPDEMTPPFVSRPSYSPPTRSSGPSMCSPSELSWTLPPSPR